MKFSLSVGLLLIFGMVHAEERSGWYLGMDNYYFPSYDARVLWSHTDLPLECDQWFPGHLEMNDFRCRPSDEVFVDPPQNFHSNGLMPGLHAGYQWSHLRLEVEYFFREHHGYEGVAPFYRSGSYLESLDTTPTTSGSRGNPKSFSSARSGLLKYGHTVDSHPSTLTL